MITLYYRIGVIFLAISLSDVVLCNEFFKTVSITKEFHHAHHHLFPFKIFKEKITPFGKFSFKHIIEKRDLNNKDFDDEHPDVSGQSETIIEAKENSLPSSSHHSDVLVTHIKYFNGKPIETLKLHSIVLPWSDENQDEEIIVQPLVGITDILNGELVSKEIIPKTKDTELKIESAIESKNEAIGDANLNPSLDHQNKPIELSESTDKHLEKENLELPNITDESLVSVNTDDKKSEVEHLEDLKKESLIGEEEVLTSVAAKPTDETIAEDKLPKEGTENEINIKTPEISDLAAAETNSIILKNVENVEESHPPINTAIEFPAVEPINTVEVTPIPIESSVPVGSLPEPVYIPLYTDIKPPVPLPAENIPPEIPPVVTEEILPVVVTEKEIIIPVPLPPIPEKTETTIIETERSPNIFSRGSRFILNFSSVILKKLMRLVTNARSNLNELSLSSLRE